MPIHPLQVASDTALALVGDQLGLVAAAQVAEYAAWGFGIGRPHRSVIMSNAAKAMMQIPIVNHVRLMVRRRRRRLAAGTDGVFANIA
jgi:hypothetical protein